MIVSMNGRVNSANDPKRTCPRSRGRYLSCAGRKQSVADFDLVGEFATQKLIDEASNLGLIAEELTELGPFKDKRPRVALGNNLAEAGLSVRKATSPRSCPVPGTRPRGRRS